MRGGTTTMMAALAALLAACGDDGGTGETTTTGTTDVGTSTSSPVPTTSSGTSTGETSGSATGTATGEPSTSSDSSTGPVTATTTTGEPDTTTTSSSTDTASDTTATADCVVPDDCTPTAACKLPTCDLGVCGSIPAPVGDLCDAGLCDGDGACVQCLGPADCPPAPACSDATCDADTCGLVPAPAGDPCDAGLCDGDGTCVECLAPADCPAPPECVSAACDAGSCGALPTAPGAPCSAGLCDGAGDCVECLAPDDCPAPPECAVPTCIADTCGTAPAMPSTPCSAGVCTADGACVACILASDCPNGQMCQNNQCVVPAPTCSDNMKNGGETDTDCGGGACPACPNGDSCFVNVDCTSLNCVNQVCTAPAPSCSDNLKNGGETDTDCGGFACPACPDGDSCFVNTDCTSLNCVNQVCVAPAPLCATMPPDPATGQRCPLFADCDASADCGVNQGCQLWFCNNGGTCELDPLSGCWTDVGGACAADLVISQQANPPVAKRFVPPDGVDFREVASLAITFKNNTATDLRLDKLPLVLDTMNGASKFDVSSVKIYDSVSASDHELGDILVHLTADPFSFPANGTMGPAAGSAFSTIPKNGGSQRFVVTVAFAANKTFIAGRGYRLRLETTAGLQLKVGTANGPLFAGTTCGVPPGGFTGAWVTAQNP